MPIRSQTTDAGVAVSPSYADRSPLDDATDPVPAATVPQGILSSPAGEVRLRRSPELADERVRVIAAGGDDDVAGLDACDGDGDDVVPQSEVPIVRGYEGDGLTGGDGFQFVLDGVGGRRGERGRTLVRARFEPPEPGPRRRRSVSSTRSAQSTSQPEVTARFARRERRPRARTTARTSCRSRVGRARSGMGTGPYLRKSWAHVSYRRVGRSSLR